MAKSIRSKVKRKFRAIKREKIAIKQKAAMTGGHTHAHTLLTSHTHTHTH
jgi:hypothetical protein